MTSGGHLLLLDLLKKTHQASARFVCHIIIRQKDGICRLQTIANALAIVPCAPNHNI